MQTSKIYFSLPENLILEFSSDTAELDKNTKRILCAYVPGIEELERKPDKVDIIFQHKKAATFKLEHGANKITLWGPWNGELIADIHHLLYAIVRINLLERNLYSVHGACVGKDGKCVLILEHSGSGKTTVALKLAKDYDMHVLSGNKTTISFNDAKMKVVAGTTAMSIRSQDQKIIGIDDGLNYKNRYIFELNQKEVNLPCEVRAIAVVRLNDYAHESTKLKMPDVLHVLYPYFLDVVNSDVIIGDRVFPGTPPEGLQDKLVSGLKRSLVNIPIYSFIGSGSFVAENISKL